MTWIDRTLLEHAWSAAGGRPDLVDQVSFRGPRVLGSRYPVADLASATVAAAALAVAEWAGADRESLRVDVDRGLCGAWFGSSFSPRGWSLPPVWDSVAGDYRCADGWIRLHTNDPRHRAAALAVLQVPARSDSVGSGLRSRMREAVSGMTGEALENAVIAAGACAAELRSPEAWRNHHQGLSLA